MKPEKLRAEFVKLCHDYVKGQDYLGIGVEKEKNACVVTIIGKAAKFQIVYRLCETLGVPPSVLYCRMYPDKNCPIYLLLPQLLPLLAVEDYRACYFPYIETAQRMADCLQALLNIIRDVFPVLDQKACAGEDRMLLENAISQLLPDEEPSDILKIGSYEQDAFLRALRISENGYAARFTVFEPWKQYLWGQGKKALLLYRRQKDLLPYEQGLCCFLGTTEGKRFSPMPKECFAQRDLETLSKGRENIGTILKCSLVLYLFSGAVFCLLMGLIRLVFSYGTVCFFGVPWYAGLLLGALPAFFGGVALRRWLIPLVSRKNAGQQLEFDDIVNASPLVDRLAICAFAATLAFSLYIGVQIAGSMVCLYDSDGKYYDDFRCQQFSYDEVEAVYYVNARYNQWGDRIERASYVIAMSDGSVIDLDGYTNPEETERRALPVFQAAGIEIKEADSLRELKNTEQ